LFRTEALATQIFNDLGNESLICLCVLKGGYKFFADLTEKIQCRNRTSGVGSLPMMLDFIRLKSYHVNIKEEEEEDYECMFYISFYCRILNR
jgi:hypoxanthine phosphoribosyltransferase